MNDTLSLKRAIDTARLNVQAAQHALDSYEVDTDSREVVEMYEDMLDGDGDVTVCGYSYSPSRILKEVDPVAYRCGANDYADSLEKDNFADYRELQEALEDAESALADAQEALDAAQEGDTK